MVITESKDVKLLVADIETLLPYTLLSFYNPDTEEWFEFEISEWKNDLYEFVKFYKKENWEYVVGYNYLGFDATIIEFILRNYSLWVDLPNLAICKKIYTRVQQYIDDQRFGAFGEFRSSDFEIMPLDVFTILGLDNAARMSSLKKVEFQLDMLNVEEMPIYHGIDVITKEQCAEVKSYCRNDVLATFEVFKLVLGNTTHNIYKGNNQLALRFDIKEEFGIDCLNYSDIKIGDELLKKSYAEAKGCKLYELPKKGYFRKEIKLSRAIPKYVEFKTPQLQKLLKDTKSKTIGQLDKHEVEFKFKNTKYTIGLGGGHSDNTSEKWEETDNIKLVDLDVGLI